MPKTLTITVRIDVTDDTDPSRVAEDVEHGLILLKVANELPYLAGIFSATEESDLGWG